MILHKSITFIILILIPLYFAFLNLFFTPQLLKHEPILIGSNNSRTPKLFLFTYVDKINKDFCLLAASAFINGIVVNVIGQKNPYECTHPSCKNINKNWENHLRMSKLFFMQKMLENSRLNSNKIFENIKDDDLIMFVDGFDVVFQSNASKIIERYLHYKKLQNMEDLILFNGDQYCFPFSLSNPDKQIEKDYGYGKITGNVICDQMEGKNEENSDLNFNPYLNSGIYIGKKANIEKMIDSVLEMFIKVNTLDIRAQSDQGYFQLLYLRKPEFQIKIDSQAKIFFVVHYFMRIPLVRPICEQDYFDEQQNPPSLKLSNGSVLDQPIVLHFPGGKQSEAHQKCNPIFIRYVRKNIMRKGYNEMYFINQDNAEKVRLKDVCN